MNEICAEIGFTDGIDQKIIDKIEQIKPILAELE